MSVFGQQTNSDTGFEFSDTGFEFSDTGFEFSDTGFEFSDTGFEFSDTENGDPADGTVQNVTQPMVQCKTELTDGDPRRRFQVRLPSKQAQILPKSLKFGRAGQKTRVKFDEVGKATEAGKVPSSNTTPGENKSGTKRNGGREGRPGRQEGLADARTKSRAAFCCSVEPTVLVAKCHEKKQKDAQKETV